MPTNAAATGAWSIQTRNNARQVRALMQSLLQNNDPGPTNGTRSGVIATTPVAGSPNLISDLRVTVSSGLTMAVERGTGVMHRSGQGPYLGWLLSSVNVTCDAAPASNPRNDIVILRVYDSAPGVGDTIPPSGPAQVEIITGTPNAVPVDPITVNSLGVYTSFPTSGGGIGIPLARAQVSTGGVITLTDLRKSASLIGGPRVLLPGDSDTAGKVGDQRYNPTTDVLEVLNAAGSWVPISKGATWAKFARRSGDGTQPLASGDQLVAFPTTVQANAAVVASGAGNTSWTVPPGTWNITVGARLLTFPAQASLFLVTGSAADETKALIVADFANAHATFSKTITLAASTTFSINAWRGASATDITSFGTDVTHIEFQRQS